MQNLTNIIIIDSKYANYFKLKQKQESKHS